MAYLDIAFPSFDDISGAASVCDLLARLRDGNGVLPPRGTRKPQTEAGTAVSTSSR